MINTKDLNHAIDVANYLEKVDEALYHCYTGNVRKTWDALAVVFAERDKLLSLEPEAKTLDPLRKLMDLYDRGLGEPTFDEYRATLTKNRERTTN